MSIDGLPDDVLCHIFLWNTTKKTQHSIVDLRRTLISTCLVCKRWHNLIYNYPLIWTRVIDYGRDTRTCVEELLRRSGSTTLEVEGSFPRNSDDNIASALIVLRIVFQHISRIVEVKLNLQSGLWAPVFCLCMGQPAPKLQVLDVTVHTGLCSYFPLPLFQNQAPFLSRLRLHGCIVNPSSRSLYNLTELRILDAPAASAPTTQEWIQALQNMPRLRYSTLVNSISLRQASLEGINRASLPNLALLNVVAFVDQVSTLLGHLDIPSSCSIRLNCYESLQPVPIEDSSTILIALRHQLAHWPTESTRRFLRAVWLNVAIRFTNSRQVGFDKNEVEEAQLKDHAIACSDPFFWVMLHCREPIIACQNYYQILALYQATFPTTTHFEFWIPGRVHGPTLTLIGQFVDFSRFTALETLSLSWHSLVYFLSHFGVLPSLRFLQLFMISFESVEVRSTVVTHIRQRLDVAAPMLELWVIGELSDSKKEELERFGNVKVKMARWDSKTESAVVDF